MKSKLSQAVKDKLKQKFSVRAFREEDFAFWLSCWNDYSGDSSNKPSKEILMKSWNLLYGKDPSMLGLMLEDNAKQKPIGFIHAIFHPSTWREEPVCYIEDAYIIQGYRTSSAFWVLYDHFVQQMKSGGYEEIYWITKVHNHRARRLYKRIAKETDWIRYDLSFRDMGQ